MVMDDLEKALRCSIELERGTCVPDLCQYCGFYQEKFLSTDSAVDEAIKRIHELEKSNRNWRRKVQRLRKELKEVKADGIS